MKIVIWGAGYNGQSLAKRLRNHQIAYFIDSDSRKINKYIERILVQKPERLYSDKNNIVIYTIDNDEIKGYLERWGGSTFII